MSDKNENEVEDELDDSSDDNSVDSPDTPDDSDGRHSEDDELHGTDDDDDIASGVGNDDLYGAGGDDHLDGGEGRDTAYYEGVYADYVIAQTEQGWTVTDLNGQIDVLVDVERIVFADTTIAIDTDDDGGAGQVFRLYSAALGREPDKEGLGYWIQQKDDGLDLVSMAEQFINSTEFQTIYGDNPSVANFLTLVYEHVLGREPDTEGYNWWVEHLDSHPEVSRAHVLADFCESAENRSAVADLVGNGIVFEPWIAGS